MVVPLVVCLNETSASVPRSGQPGPVRSQTTWKTTLDFSSRYVLMLAPMMRYLLSKLISVYFPKRLLLSFLVVFAFPMAWRGTPPCQVRNSERACEPRLCHTSVMGLEARTLSSTRALLPDLLTTAKYLMAYRADTVLPAPDSPLTMMDWFLWFLKEKVHRINAVVMTLSALKCPLCIPGHLFVSLLRHGKYMRVHVTHVLARVGVNDCISINGKLFVWIYSHQNDTCK